MEKNQQSRIISKIAAPFIISSGAILFGAKTAGTGINQYNTYHAEVAGSQLPDSPEVAEARATVAVFEAEQELRAASINPDKATNSIRNIIAGGTAIIAGLIYAVGGVSEYRESKKNSN